MELLPALPSAWQDGSIKGLVARGGFEVSMDWNNGQLSKVKISAKNGGRTKLVCNGKEKVVDLNAGEEIKLVW